MTLLYKPLLTQISNESVKRTSSNLQGFWLFLYLRRRKVLHLDIHYFNKETHFFIFRMPEPKSSTQPNSRSNFTKRVFFGTLYTVKIPHHYGSKQMVTSTELLILSVHSLNSVFTLSPSRIFFKFARSVVVKSRSAFLFI